MASLRALKCMQNGNPSPKQFTFRQAPSLKYVYY